MEQYLGFMLVILGGALAAGLAGCGSAIGCGIVGQAAAGVTSEDPNKFGLLLVLQALPGTQGFYGFVGMFLILGKLAGVNVTDISISQGLAVAFAGLPVGLVGLISAIYQGKVCAGGANLVARRPEEIAKAMVYGAVVETYAILGLISTILLLQNVKLG
ncbi:MAG: V-type ATP synthase subunit K [Endomicrobia bacterium]|nr:V-type ATP synthase subunit K [Endomicrobiia bacterium]MCX7940651.1 V-type ATP synthase subunit K [Endomicrobiia bacterium]MDW8056385.1 V-type ATP synthase subunit K [Elusimicrobiota bacterium]